MKESIHRALLLFMMLMSIGMNKVVLSAQDERDSLRSSISTMHENNEKVDNLLALGWLFYNRDWDSAIYYNKQAETLASRLGYQQGLADAWYRLSLIYKNLPDFKISQEYLDKYIDLALNLNDTTRIAKGYFQQAGIFKVMSKNELALSSCHSSRDIEL